MCGLTPELWYKAIHNNRFVDAFTGIAGKLLKLMAAQVDMAIAYYAINGSAAHARIFKEYVQQVTAKSGLSRKSIPIEGAAEEAFRHGSRVIERITREIAIERDAAGIPPADYTVETPDEPEGGEDAQLQD
jgi:hypothetical protein